MMTAPIDEEKLSEVSGGTQIPYVIQPGDTLVKLAEKFNCTVEQICRWNNITDPNRIIPGQKLIFRF